MNREDFAHALKHAIQARRQKRGEMTLNLGTLEALIEQALNPAAFEFDRQHQSHSYRWSPNIPNSSASMREKRGDCLSKKYTQSASGCRTAPVIGSVCSVTITWPSSFADTNYRAECGGRLVSSGVPLNGGLTAFTAAAVTFQTVAGTDAAAQYANIDCVRMHN